MVPWQHPWLCRALFGRESQTYTFGAAPDGPFPRYFQGQIDEAAIYHRALTLQEIQLHYQYGQAGVSYDSDIIPPSVVSILRASPSPTAAASVDFTVTFSEPVSGVDTTDFVPNTSGITGRVLHRRERFGHNLYRNS